MTRAARYGYVLLSVAFAAGLVVQVFLAGLGLFAGGRNFATHAELGWVLHLAPVLVLLAAALSRAGRFHWQWALALAVVVFIVPIFATMRGTMPVAAALHPVAAMVAFALALVVARNSFSALRTPPQSQPVA